ncbi:hypothetical protein [Deinococcus apachensis]|uniref:hypothetical protein n=1 Tax=Deinococcus apachensis TaxID=309886 RepID=UPI0012FAFE5B|nr:hypothetical protein [Deinococcus apachensis]
MLVTLTETTARVLANRRRGVQCDLADRLGQALTVANVRRPPWRPPRGPTSLLRTST